MPLQSANTILREAPYFDDFNEDKGYARVLFKPGVALQARELNQLQSMLQNQIERFGSHVFKAGSVVAGCAEKPVRNMRYVALARSQDREGISFTFDEKALIGCVAVGQQFDASAPATQAKIIAARAGFERDGDPSKIFVQYSSGAVNSFSSSSALQERIRFYRSDDLLVTDVELKVVVDAASLDPEVDYLSPEINNTESSLLTRLTAEEFLGVVFTNEEQSWSGTLAAVREDTTTPVILPSAGTPTAGSVVVRTLRFRNCTGFPRVNDRITATAGPAGNNDEISCTLFASEVKPWNAEEVFVGETFILAPISFAGGLIPANGDASGFEIGGGIIFQKGQFSKVAGQLIVVNPSSIDTSNYAVGFTTVEEVVSEFVDSSLYDNAFFEGGNNLNAPGAHRLKLTPTLIAVKRDEIGDLPEGSEFLPLFEFNSSGEITIKRTDPQYAALGNELARRTWEESGNYVVNDLFATIQDVDGDKGTFRYIVTPGIAYINGKRVEILNPAEFESSMGTDLSNEQLLATSLSSLYSKTTANAPAYDRLEVYDTSGTARTVFAPGQSITAATAVFIKAVSAGDYATYSNTAPVTLPATTTTANVSNFGVLLNNITGARDVAAFTSPASAAAYTMPVEWVWSVGNPLPGSLSLPANHVAFFVGEDEDNNGTYPVVGLATSVGVFFGGDRQSGTPLFTRRIDGTVVETSNTVSYAVTKTVSTEILNVSGALEITVTSEDIGQIKGIIPRADVAVSLGNANFANTTTFEVATLTDPKTAIELGDYIRIAGSSIHRVTNIAGSVVTVRPAGPGTGTQAVERFYRAHEYRSIDETTALQLQKNYSVENSSSFSRITILGGAASTTEIGVDLVYVTKADERPIMRKEDARGIKVRLRINDANKSAWRSLGVADAYRLQSVVDVETGASVQHQGFRPGRQNKFLGHSNILINNSTLASKLTNLSVLFDVSRSSSVYTFSVVSGASANDTLGSMLKLQLNDQIIMTAGSTTYRKMIVTAVDRIANTFTATVVGTTGTDPSSITTLEDVTVALEGSLVEVTFDAFIPAEGTEGPATASSYPFRVFPRPGYFFKNTDAPACECSLPDTLDFRPIAEPSFDVRELLAGRVSTPINPEFIYSAITGTNKAVPSPVLSRTDKIGAVDAVTRYRKFVGRKETIAINENGAIELIAGVSSDSRLAPRISAAKMALATVDIPPYPSTQFVTKALKPTKRYTMEDISVLEQRIEDIEEYVSLTLLEKDTIDLEITGPDGLPRFKNGIFVDSLNDSSFMEDPSLLYIQDGRAIPPIQFIEIPLEVTSETVAGQQALQLVLDGIYKLPESTNNDSTTLVAQRDASKPVDVAASAQPLIFNFTPSVVQRNAQNGIAQGASVPFTGIVQFGARQGRKYAIEFNQAQTTYSTGWVEASATNLTIEGALSPGTWRVNEPILVRLTERSADLQVRYVSVSSLFISSTAVAPAVIPPRVIDTDPTALWPGCPYLTANNMLTGLYSTEIAGQTQFFDAYGLCSLWFEPFVDAVDLEDARYHNRALPWLHEFSSEGNYTISTTGANNNIPLRVYHFPVSRCSGNGTTQNLTTNPNSAQETHLGLFLKPAALRRYYGTSKTSLDSLRSVKYVFLDNEAGLPTANSSVFAGNSFTRATGDVGFQFEDYSCGWANLIGTKAPRIRSQVSGQWTNLLRDTGKVCGVQFAGVSVGASSNDPQIGSALNQYNFGLPSYGLANFNPSNPLEASSGGSVIWTNQPASYEQLNRQYLYWATAPAGASHLGNTSVRYGAFSARATVAGVVRYVHRSLNSAKALSVYGEYEVVNPAGAVLNVIYPPFKNGQPAKNVVMNQVQYAAGAYGQVGEFGCGEQLVPTTPPVRGVYSVQRMADGDNNVVIYNGYQDCGSPCGLDGDRGTTLLDGLVGDSTTYEIDLNAGNYSEAAALLLTVTVPAGFVYTTTTINSRKAQVTITRTGQCPEPEYTVLPGGYQIRRNMSVAYIDLGVGGIGNDNRITINLCP